MTMAPEKVGELLKNGIGNNPMENALLRILAIAHWHGGPLSAEAMLLRIEQIAVAALRAR